MEGMHWITSLFTLAVLFGAVYMFFTRPKQTNALISSTTDSIAGITKAWEGR